MIAGKLLLASAAVAATIAPLAPALASSHREAPQITEMPKVDNTDVYAFRSYEPGREAFTTIISNFQPGENPGDGPNYYTMDPDAIYEIHIDNTGDAVEDLTYQFRFSNLLKSGSGISLTVGGVSQPIALRAIGPLSTPGDANLGEDETFTATLVTGNRRTGARTSIANASGGATTFIKPHDNTGNKTIPGGYETYANKFIYSVNIPGCSTPARMFVGQRAEYFAVNLGPIFDLVNFVPISGDNDPVYGNGSPFPGGITQSQDNQELIGKKNVTSIALEVPTACVTSTANNNGVIGVWSSASLPQARLLRTAPTFAAPSLNGGSYVQVSRLGMPLVNEVVIGLPQKDLFNAVKPTADSALASYVTNPTFPAILNALFRAPVNATLGTSFADLAPTNFPRNDLVATFLTGFPGVNQIRAMPVASEMLRLNTAIPVTPRASQRALGVVADDLAGFPNGRRPGDDTVDIVLRVAMGRLCHPIPVNGAPTNLGLCTPAQAPTGLVAYTDGAPSNAMNILGTFPYLNPPLRGAPRPQTQP